MLYKGIMRINLCHPPTVRPVHAEWQHGHPSSEKNGISVAELAAISLLLSKDPVIIKFHIVLWIIFTRGHALQQVTGG
jgi:hypothetical protein